MQMVGYKGAATRDNPLLPFFQTLNSISAEKNSTIIFPLPIDFITHFMKDGSTPKGEKED